VVVGSDHFKHCCSFRSWGSFSADPLANSQIAKQWNEDQQIAHTLDNIMDRCSLQRYFYLSSWSFIYGFTRHSASGPLLFLEYNMLQSEYLVSKTLENLDDANIIVFQKKTSALYIEKQFYDLTQGEVVDNFTLTPPKCAGETIHSDRFVLLFRKSGPNRKSCRLVTPIWDDEAAQRFRASQQTRH